MCQKRSALQIRKRNTCIPVAHAQWEDENPFIDIDDEDINMEALVFVLTGPDQEHDEDIEIC